MSKIILPGAWEMTSNDWQNELFYLVVPNTWQQIVQSLAYKRYQAGYAKYPSAPVYSLNSIVAACFPSIIQTVRNAWKYPGSPWILAKEKVDLSYLPYLIKDWLREEFYRLEDKDVEATLERLEDDAWEWEREAIGSESLKENYRIDVRFQALPDYLAGEFLKNPTVNFTGETAEYQLTFYRVVSSREGAELVSWPPNRVLKDNKEAYISLVISFQLRTVPWQNISMIYHQLSVRSWITKLEKELPYNGANAYIGDSMRWWDGATQPFCFIPLQLRSRPKSSHAWPKAIEQLLDGSKRLPDPNLLAARPQYEWSQRAEEEQKGVQIAIAYDNRHSGGEPCAKGVSYRDLASIDLAIQERLPLQRAGEFVKTSGNTKSLWKTEDSTKSKKSKDTKEPKDEKTKGSKEPKDPNDLTTPMLRPKFVAPVAFNNAQTTPQTILILWETEKCRDALVAKICELLSLSKKGETHTYQVTTSVIGERIAYEGEFGSLEIVTQHILDLGQKLDVNAKDKNRQKRRVDLLPKRIEKIVSLLPEPKGLAGAIIEIKKKKDFFPPESDPKLALRIGAMKAGYVNQHINPLTALKKTGEKYVLKDADNRVQQAVSDLLRQFGILPAPLIDFKKDQIEPNIWLTCFHVLRRTRKTTASNKRLKMALMVRVNPQTAVVEITTPSLFPKWVLYREGLGCLINEKLDQDDDTDKTTEEVDNKQVYKDKKEQQKFLNKFASDCLRDCLSTPIEEGKKPRVLFMAEAQNARLMLPWLQDPNLPENSFPQEIKGNMTEAEQNRLWIVRLRSAVRREVPVGIVKNDPGAKTTGLFRWENLSKDYEYELYFSAREALNTETGKKTLQKKQSRLDDGKRKAGSRRLLEIAVVYSPGIEPEKLAVFVHSLRNRWPYFAKQVSLPLPFPLATKAKEYAVSVTDKVESDTDEESDESE